MKFRLSELDIPSDEPFRNDALERKPIVDFLTGLLNNFNGPFVLALDSPWGTGKTTLVRMLKARLEQENFQCIYFNAWQADYVTDPLVALVSEIDSIELANKEAETQFKKHFKTVKKITSVVVKRGFIAVAKAATLGALDVQRDVEAVASELTGGLVSDAVDAFQKEKAALKNLRTELEGAVSQLKVAGKKESLIFFIDELDRCRPTFAIEVLERIKHLFDLSNIIFVLSVDKTQLAASVAAVYGEKSNTQEYLRRFFDLEFGIPQINSKSYTQVLITRFELDEFFAKRISGASSNEKNDFINYFSEIANVFQLSLRVRERCATMLAVVLHQTKEKESLNVLLVAFLIVLRAKRVTLFQALCNGSISPELVMAEIAKLSGGQKFFDSRLGILTESYLGVRGVNSEDNSEKISLYYKMLEDSCESTSEKEALRSRAQEILKFRGEIIHNQWFGFDYRNIAAKIDLAASFRE